MCPVQYLSLEPFYLVPDDIPSSGLFGTLEKKWLLVLVKTLCIHRNCLWKVVISSRGSDVNCASRLYRSLKCVPFLKFELLYCCLFCVKTFKFSESPPGCLPGNIIYFLHLSNTPSIRRVFHPGRSSPEFNLSSFQLLLNAADAIHLVVQFFSLLWLFPFLWGSPCKVPPCVLYLLWSVPSWQIKLVPFPRNAKT